MSWNLNYNYCAIILLFLVVVFYFTRKNLPLKRNKTFGALLLCALFSIVFDTTSAIAAMNMDVYSIGFANALFYLYYFFQFMTPVLYAYYVICWTGVKLGSKPIAAVLFGLPVGIVFITLINNLTTGSVFYFNQQLEYVRGPARYVVVFASIYVMIYSFVFQKLYGELIPLDKKILINSFVVFSIVAVIYQSQNNDELVIGYATAISLVIIYYMAQNYGENIDTGTKVFNRSLFTQIIGINLKSKKEFNVMVLAMDDFKFINKTFGVDVGDRLLVQVARYLDNFIPKGMAFRFGTDQFCLVFPTTAGNMEAFAHTMYERFRHPWVEDGLGVMMSATISCIACPQDANTVEGVIDVIDYSVLISKLRGKGSILNAIDINLEQMRQDKAVEKALKYAMDRDLLEVYYQPIFNNSSGTFSSAEALVRLIDDELGMVSPDIFIPLAEKNGDILKLGEAVFEKVCKFISENNIENTCLDYIEVNVSVVQCMQTDFVEKLIATMDKYKVKPETINLEITETAAVNSANILQVNMNKLTECGIKFSLDDYGSGYSTLDYINQLPFSLIKLDKVIIWDAFNNYRAGITLKHTVGMLKELELMIVAEGVETEEQQMHLKAIGCDYLQGWYYSKAIPEMEFIQFLENAG